MVVPHVGEILVLGPNKTAGANLVRSFSPFAERHRARDEMRDTNVMHEDTCFARTPGGGRTMGGRIGRLRSSMCSKLLSIGRRRRAIACFACRRMVRILTGWPTVFAEKMKLTYSSQTMFGGTGIVTDLILRRTITSRRTIVVQTGPFIHPSALGVDTPFGFRVSDFAGSLAARRCISLT
jgi:hypothetical protein